MSFFDNRRLSRTDRLLFIASVMSGVMMLVSGCTYSGDTVETVTSVQDQPEWKLVAFTMETRSRLREQGIRVMDWQLKKGSVRFLISNEKLTIYAPNAEDLTIEKLQFTVDKIFELVTEERRSGRRITKISYRLGPNQNLSAIKDGLSIEFQTNSAPPLVTEEPRCKEVSLPAEPHTNTSGGHPKK